MVNVIDILHYGERIKSIEIDICTHQFEYKFNECVYLITKYKGDVISVYKISEN